MPMQSLVPTFILALAVGLLADWIGAPPAWLRRAFDAAAAAARPPAGPPAGGGGGWRRKVAAVAGAATLVGIGGGFAVHMVLSLLVIEFGVARLSGAETGLAVASAIAVGTGVWVWWATAAADRRHTPRRAR